MKSMLITKSGKIAYIIMQLSGNVNTQRINGCGVASAEHPMLNWAFQERRLVYLSIDTAGCTTNVSFTQ